MGALKFGQKQNFKAEINKKQLIRSQVWIQKFNGSWLKYLNLLSSTHLDNAIHSLLLFEEDEEEYDKDDSYHFNNFLYFNIFLFTYM